MRVMDGMRSKVVNFETTYLIINRLAETGGEFSYAQ